MSVSTVSAQHLQNSVLAQISAQIREYAGIDIPQNRYYFLKGRIERRIKELNLDSLKTYAEFLASSKGEREMEALINEVTVNETFFFRQEGHIRFLEKYVLPELARKQAQVHLWSAACSSGEEIYTLALMVEEYWKKQFPGLRFHLLASDIDSSVLKEAQEGKYSTYSVRKVPRSLLQKYFTQRNGLYCLSPTIIRQVQFKKINLCRDRDYLGLSEQDVIFCANVLIYFDKEVKIKVVENLHRKLKKGGYLILGFSETLYGISDKFETVRKEGVMTYRKT